MGEALPFGDTSAAKGLYLGKGSTESHELESPLNETTQPELLPVWDLLTTPSAG